MDIFTRCDKSSFSYGQDELQSKVYLLAGRGREIGRDSGPLGDQSSGGKATRQNCGRGAENSRPISALLPRTGPRNTTEHSCSSVVRLCCRLTRLPLVKRA